MINVLTLNLFFNDIILNLYKQCRIFFMIPLLLYIVSIHLANGQEESIPLLPKSTSEQMSIVRTNTYSQGITLYEFSNGLTLFIRRDTLSSMGTVRVLIRNTGLLNESLHAGTGISHLLEQMILEGSTQTRTQKEIVNALNKMGGIEESKTDLEFTGYSVVCPSKSLLYALELLTDQLLKIDIDQKTFNTIKSKIKNKISVSYRDSTSLGRFLLMQTCYLKHPIRLPVEGYTDLLDRLKYEDLLEFYESRYTPNQMVIMVTGDVNTSQILQDISKHFEGMARKKEPEIPLSFEPTQIAARSACREWNGKTYELFMAWPTVVYSDKDKYALDLLAKIMTGGEAARLNRLLQNKQRLFLSIDTFTINPSSVPGLFGFRATVLEDKVMPFRVALLEQIKNLAETELTNIELYRAKKHCMTEFIFERQKIQNTADQILRRYLLTGDPNFDFTYLNKINSVTVADIQEIVKKYFRPETLNEVLICPKGKLPQSISLSQNNTNLQPAINVHTLPSNKLHYLIKYVPEADFVNIQIIFLAGTLYDTAQNNGRSALLAKMFKQGSTELNRDAIATGFDTIGGQWKIKSGRNCIIFSATVLRDDFPSALHLLSEMLLRPAFTPESFSLVQREQLDDIINYKSYTANEVFNRFLENVPERSTIHFPLEGTEESIKKLTNEDIIGFYHEHLNARNLVVSIFGGVDISKASELLEKTFSVVPPGNKDQDNPFDQSVNILESVEHHYQTDKETAAGIKAWPTVDIITDKKEYAAMLIIQTLLGGYRKPGGILKELLLDQNLVWQMKTEQMKTPMPGYLYVSFEAPEENLKKAFLQIDRGMELIINGTISNEDFLRAKEELLAGLQFQMQTLEDEASQTGLEVLFGLNVNYRSELYNQIRSLTKETVFAIARKYIGHHIIVSVSPHGLNNL